MGFTHTDHSIFWRFSHRKLKFEKYLDIEMGKILLLDELRAFHKKSTEIEQKISEKTQLHNDIDVLTEYINEINRLIKILKAKKKSIKNEIKEFKYFTDLLDCQLHD